MHDAPSTARLLAVARGEEAPDAVIEGAQVFCAFTREWLEGDVAIAEGRFAGVGSYEGGERIDGHGRWLSAGFIDAHMHVESCKLSPAELARVLLARGTTTIVCDPHELANVLGPEGVHWFIDACDALPLEVLVFAPSAVPASSFESPRAPLSLQDVAGILARDRVIGLAEMMNYPAVIAGVPEELAKIELAGGKRIDGHAPGVAGSSLDAYLATGISSDHEATVLGEALEKRRRGAWVLLREASNARNLRDLLPLVREYGPERCAFCTDDREPDFLLREGHIDQMCRVAVAQGITPEDALLLATLHPALCHGLPRVGAIAPGYRADCILLDDLGSFRAALVLKDGRVVARDGITAPFDAVPAPEWVRESVRVAAPAADAFLLPHDGERVRVIGLIKDQILTDHLVLTPSVRAGRGRRRPRARSREDRGTRAPPRHRTYRPGPRQGVRLAARRRRLDGGARRAQHRRGRHGRRRPPMRRRACGRDRWRDRDLRGRRVARGVAAAGRRPDVGRAGGGRGREPRPPSRGRAGARVDARGAVHDAQLPGACR